MPAIVPDVYADELDRIELCAGNNVRLVYVTYRHGEKVVVANLVRPLASVKMLGNSRFEALLNGARAKQFQPPSDMH